MNKSKKLLASLMAIALMFSNISAFASFNDEVYSGTTSLMYEEYNSEDLHNAQIPSDAATVMPFVPPPESTPSIFNNWLNVVDIPSEVLAENNPTQTRRSGRIHFMQNQSVGDQPTNIQILNAPPGFSGGVIGQMMREATVAAPICLQTFPAVRYTMSQNCTNSGGTETGNFAPQFSSVVSVGVDHILIRVGTQQFYDPADPEAWVPWGIKIVPLEEWTRASATGIFCNATVYTNIPAGTLIFGGRFTPHVGSPFLGIFDETPGGHIGGWVPFDAFYEVNEIETPFSPNISGRVNQLMICLYESHTDNGNLMYVEFENWAAGDTVNGALQNNNGRVLMSYPAAPPIHIADMVQRVQGTNNVESAEFAHAGRVYTVNPGLIGFSTEQHGERGAFQLAPVNQAVSNNQVGQSNLGIIAHIGASLTDTSTLFDPIWEGVAPLFAGYITGRHIEGNLEATTFFRVSSDLGQTWQDLPSADSSAAAWTNIRLYINYIEVINVTSIALRPPAFGLQLGDSHTLIPDIEPFNATNPDVIWSSENDAIATVSDTGQVTGIALGQTVITATTVDGGLEANVTVTVTTEPTYIPTITVESMLPLSPGDFSISVNGARTLATTVLPLNADNRDLNWSSNNEAVAMVDANGRVTGVSIGSAIITATSDCNNSVYATAEVRVTEHSVFNNWMNVSIPSQVIAENNPNLRLSFEIFIENWDGGNILAIYDRGGPNDTRVNLGSVTSAATLPSWTSDGFWAARYTRGQNGTFANVIAAATNNVHLRVGPQLSHDPFDYRVWGPRQISIVPVEGTNAANVIHTDIPGGYGIFGGQHTPFVGNPLFAHTAAGWIPLDEFYYDGDFDKAFPARLIIQVYESYTDRGDIEFIEFENWAAGDTISGTALTNNGRVLMRYPNESPVHIADVIQRVQGTGRFGGGEFSHSGRVRATHPGVLCLSTSPHTGTEGTANIDLIGGFQFIPANHGKFLAYDLGQGSFIRASAPAADQWGIISYIGADPAILGNRDYIIDGRVSYDPIWDGIAPIFAGYISSRHVEGDLTNSVFYRVSEDFGRTWQDPPNIQGVTNVHNSPMANWTNVRVYLNHPAVEAGASVETLAITTGDNEAFTVQLGAGLGNEAVRAEIVSSNENIVTVSLDEITKTSSIRSEGISPGTANITITFFYDSDRDPRTVVISVTVANRDIGNGDTPRPQPTPDPPPPPPPPQPPEDEDAEELPVDPPPLAGSTIVIPPLTQVAPPPEHTDIAGHWAELAIIFVYQHGLMRGISDTHFAPDEILSRAMTATILWRLAGEPAAAHGEQFIDVATGQWYSEAILWASANGVVSGIGEGRFNPNGEITREQFAAMVFRFAEAAGIDTSVPDGHTLVQFTDAWQVSDWAVGYMLWATYTGLISGIDSVTLAPTGTISRAQCATILHRFIETFLDEEI